MRGRRARRAASCPQPAAAGGLPAAVCEASLQDSGGGGLTERAGARRPHQPRCAVRPGKCPQGRAALLAQAA